MCLVMITGDRRGRGAVRAGRGSTVGSRAPGTTIGAPSVWSARVAIFKAATNQADVDILQRTVANRKSASEAGPIAPSTWSTVAPIALGDTIRVSRCGRGRAASQCARLATCDSASETCPEARPPVESLANLRLQRAGSLGNYLPASTSATRSTRPASRTLCVTSRQALHLRRRARRMASQTALRRSGSRSLVGSSSTSSGASQEAHDEPGSSALHAARQLGDRLTAHLIQSEGAGGGQPAETARRRAKALESAR